MAVELLTTPGSGFYTVPAGVTELQEELVGAGGLGGDGAPANDRRADGVHGGQTSFGTLIALGGEGAAGGFAFDLNGLNARGGRASGGDVNIDGEDADGGASTEDGQSGASGSRDVDGLEAYGLGVGGRSILGGTGNRGGGGGGAGGAYVLRRVLAVTPGQIIPYTVGSPNGAIRLTYTSAPLAPPLSSLTLGAPGFINTGAGRAIIWSGLSGRRVPAGFIVNNAEAYLRRLAITSVVTAATDEIRVDLTLSPTDSGSGFAAGPELILTWRMDPRALTIRAGSLAFPFHGPGVAGITQDATEPYNWIINDSPTDPNAVTQTQDSFRIFLNSYNALSGTVKAATTLEFGGAIPAASAIVGSLGASARGTAGVGPLEGEASATLGSVGASARGALGAEPHAGRASAAIAEIRSAAAGALLIPRMGRAAATLSELRAAATGALLPPLPGRAAAVIGGIRASATGALLPPLSGRASAVIGSVGASARGRQGAEPLPGRAAAALGELRAAATPRHPLSGAGTAVVASLGASARGALGAEPLPGRAMAVLGALQALAAGFLPDPTAIVIGAPQTFVPTGAGPVAIWNPPAGPRRISTALVVGGVSAYVRFFRLRWVGLNRNELEVQLRVSPTDSGQGSEAGPELLLSWRMDNRALTIRAGGVSFTFHGPGVAGITQDATEPYTWFINESPTDPDAVTQTEASFRAFLASYNALPGSVRAATTLEFGSGPLPGFAAADLGELRASATPRQPLAGRASAIAGVLAASAKGFTPLTGEAAAALGELRSSATPRQPLAGRASAVAGVLAASARGFTPRDGEASAIVGSLGASARGVLGPEPLPGHAMAVLGVLSAEAANVEPLMGVAAAALGAIRASATGALGAEPHTGRAAATLGEIRAAATGALLNPLPGRAAAVVGSLGVSARGALGGEPLAGRASAVAGILAASAKGFTPLVGEASAVVGSLGARARGMLTIDVALAATFDGLIGMRAALLVTEPDDVELAATFDGLIGMSASLLVTEPDDVELAATFDGLIGMRASLSVTEPDDVELAATFDGVIGMRATLTVLKFISNFDQAARIQAGSLIGTEPIYAMEITHPGITDPVRAVADTIPHVIENHTYMPLAFRAKPPTFQKGQTPTSSIEIDNVGRRLTRWIDLTQGGEGAKIRLMKVQRDPASGQSEPVWDVSGFSPGVSQITEETVRLNLVFRNGKLRPGIKKRHTPINSPGLF